uniref:Peptidase M6-like domain-containing protein n=1 Tax=Physcomitrium patens TaxID=3218 RepID=A0A7I4AMP4_PHYPA
MAPLASIVVRPHAMEDRCLVAPHPEVRQRLLTRYNEIKATIAQSSELSFLRSVLRPIERRPPGFNDGLLRPGPTFRPGMTFAAQLKERVLLRGDVNVIVVLVDFSDQKFTPSQTKEHYAKLWFQEGSNSVKDYFRDVSNNKVDIKGEVVGPYRMPKPISYYANEENGTGSTAPNARTMARDAAILANPKVYSYLTVPADCKLGVCAHELGHLAFGWPDLYDADYTSSGIGDWCLMAGGSYNGNEDNPATPCAWCKVDQGWVEVITPKETQKVSLPDVKDEHKVLKLWTDGVAMSEYFLVENRQLKGRDKDLPAGGLLVWHIDETKDDNTSEQTNYKVALVQSDGLMELERTKRDQGDNGDPFPGVKGVRVINTTTNPSTKGNNGVPTGVAISDISDPADVMTFTVSVSNKNPAKAQIGEGSTSDVAKIHLSTH